MDPLHPSPYVLRVIAAQLADSPNKVVRAWVDAMSKKFAKVSIVATKRGGKLCGYEVWRHLASRQKDPTRKKARLWFGLRPQHLGGETVDAYTSAQRAGRWMASLSDRELIAWHDRQAVIRKQQVARKERERIAERERRKAQQRSDRDERLRARRDECARRQHERRARVAGVYPHWEGGRVVAYIVRRKVAGRRYELSFGVSHWRSELGYDDAARDVAVKAAQRLFAMTPHALREWWIQRKRVNRGNMVPPEHMEGAVIDFAGLQQMSHVFARAS